MIICKRPVPPDYHLQEARFSGWSFARGRILWMIICKWPVPPNDHMQAAGSSRWSFANSRPTKSIATKSLFSGKFSWVAQAKASTGLKSESNFSFVWFGKKLGYKWSKKSFATLTNLVQSLAWSGSESLTKVTNRNESATSQGNDWSTRLGSDKKGWKQYSPLLSLQRTTPKIHIKECNTQLLERTRLGFKFFVIGAMMVPIHHTIWLLQQ